jgi:hypothetical protein
VFQDAALVYKQVDVVQGIGPLQYRKIHLRPVLPVPQDGEALHWIEQAEEAVQDRDTICLVNRVTSDREKVRSQPIHCLGYTLLMSPNAVQMQIAELGKRHTASGQKCLWFQYVVRNVDLVPFVDQAPSAACRESDTQGANQKLAAAYALCTFRCCSVHPHFSTCIAHGA